MAVRSSQTTDGSAKGYRVLRYHRAIRIGTVPTAHGRRQEPTEIHLRQSSADSACALHVVGMLFILLDLAKRSAILMMSSRKYGVAAELFDLLGFSWLEGVFADRVVEALESMSLPVTVRWKDGFDNGVDAFAVAALKKGSAVLVAYESLRDRHRHFTLGVGCGGVMEGSSFTVDTLLVLDPSSDAMPYACCNGMLQIGKAVDFARRRSSVIWHYVNSGQSEPVRLMSAISVVRNDDQSAAERRVQKRSVR